MEHHTRARLIAMLAIAGTLTAPGMVGAQTIRPDDFAETPAEAATEPAAAPGLAPSVSRLLESEYLRGDEGRDLRLFHGVWRESDIDSPDAAAAAALLRGALNDPALEMTADVEDRAEAMVLRGECEEALRLLAEPTSMRAIRLRVEALEQLGRFDAAVAEAEAAQRVVLRGAASDAANIVEAVRMLIVRSRIVGGGAGGAADFHAMMNALGQARERIDRLYWPTYLAEAELLYAKDNPAKAAEALQQTLALNPQVAAAWAIIGRMGVDGFNFANAEAVALRLEKNAGVGPDNDIVQPWAAMIRCRARLRQRDAHGAWAALKPAAEAYPKMREVLALKCAVEAARFNYRQVEDLLAEFDAISPGSPLALFEVGAVLSEARQYEAAAEYLQRAAERLPNWPEPWIELGLLEMQSGRDAEAIAALERAYELDPFNIRAENSLRLARELRGYSTVESDHFIVRYRPGVDEVLAREMLAPLEENHRLVTASTGGGFDHEPAQKTVIELLPDHKWFGVRIAGMPRIHTIAASTGPVIAMEAPREGANHLGVYDWVRVLRHEYAHTVTLSRTNNRIPHWFTEAAAVFVEFAPRDYDTCILLARALQEGTLFDLEGINIAFVRPEKPTDRAQAYAQGHWMYEFIVKRWGERAPLDLMDLYAEGVPEPVAFEQVLGTSRDSFMEQFREWARGQVIAWGLALPEGTPTTEQLLIAEALADPARRAGAEAGLERLAEDAALVAAGGGGSVEPFALSQPALTDEMVDRWRSEHPEHPGVLALAVERALNANRGQPTAEMVDLLESYAAARPVDPMPHRALAMLYLSGEAGEPADAIPHLEYLDARETRAATWAVELAKRYRAAGQAEPAAAKAERATQIAPYDADWRELAATIALQRRDFKTAARHIEALTILEPDREIHRKRLQAVRARLAE